MASPPQYGFVNGVWIPNPVTWFPATNAVAGAGVSTNLSTAQSFTTIAANGGLIALDGTSAVKLTTNANAKLAVPVSIFMQMSSATGNSGTLTIDGEDQFGVRGTEQIAFAATSTTWGSVRCYRMVYSASIVTNAGTTLSDTVALGWKLSNNTSAFPNRYPLPFRLKAAADVVGVIPMNVGGSNVASITAGIGRVITTIDVNNSTIAFASGTITDQPTGFMQFAILLASGAERKYL